MSEQSEKNPDISVPRQNKFDIYSNTKIPKHIYHAIKKGKIMFKTGYIYNID